MDILKIAVCDDEESALEIICGAVGTAFRSQKSEADIEKFSSVQGLEERMITQKFDLLLLDIKLRNDDGIEFGRRLRKKKDDTQIIFISSCSERVFDAFSVHPFGFIRKSHFLKDITDVISSFIESRQSGRNSSIVLKVKDSTFTISIHDIIFIEGMRKYQLIYTRGREEPIQIQNSMESLEQQLSDHGFLRIHKGFLVNCRFIKLIGGHEVELSDGRLIPISRRKAQEARDYFLAFMQKGGALIL